MATNEIHDATLVAILETALRQRVHSQTQNVTANRYEAEPYISIWKAQQAIVWHHIITGR